jgi:hypothetical protein
MHRNGGRVSNPSRRPSSARVSRPALYSSAANASSARRARSVPPALSRSPRSSGMGSVRFISWSLSVSHRLKLQAVGLPVPAFQSGSRQGVPCPCRPHALTRHRIVLPKPLRGLARSGPVPHRSPLLIQIAPAGVVRCIALAFAGARIEHPQHGGPDETTWAHCCRVTSYQACRCRSPGLPPPGQ